MWFERINELELEKGTITRSKKKVNNLSPRCSVVSAQFPKEFIFKEVEIRKNFPYLSKGYQN